MAGRDRERGGQEKEGKLGYSIGEKETGRREKERGKVLKEVRRGGEQEGGTPTYSILPPHSVIYSLDWNHCLTYYHS